MNRRRFLLTASAVPAALNSAASAALGPAPDDCTPRAARNGGLTLSSRELAWRLEWRDRKLSSTRFENRLSGRTFTLSDVQELELIFSASKFRVEIPWWKFTLGPDQEPGNPNQEQGVKLGFHMPEFADHDWGATENLLLRNLRGVESLSDPIAYEGYGWFRRWFELPADALREEIVFVLGGYDYHDWKEYWVFLNGVEVGHRESVGRWRTPGQFAVAPGSKAHSSIRFGPGGNNLLGVRTRAYERRFGGLSDEVLRHYVFEPVIVDQFISVGTPSDSIADFEVRNVIIVSESEAIVQLESASRPLTVSARYKLDGETRRKELEVRNRGSEQLMLLDVHLDQFTLDATTTEGGHGIPVFAGDEIFCAIEHPAGINAGDHGRVRTTHFPGRFLPPGGSIRTHVSLVSVSEPGQALDHFVSYIQERSPRKKKVISMYDTFGVNNQWGACPTLSDVEMLEELKILEKWRRQGVALDYFVPDTGWIDHSSDLTQFAPQCFPGGPEKVVEAASQAGMKFGLWFPVSWGAMSNSENPAVWPDQIPTPGEEGEPGPPPLVYESGYLKQGGAPARLCIASEPYFTMFRNAIQRHIGANKLRFYKLDGINSYCNSTRHEHLPGKYSVEAAYNRLIEIARRAREAEPDITLIWYWGVRSPFFALHGDCIFESGLYMEGAGTSWFPALHYRDSVSLNLDQSTRFASTIPPINKDSLGVWLADNRWGNFMGSERWREGLIMDLGRGNLLFPQLWGDLSLLDDRDVEFLASMQAFVKRNESILLSRRRTFGDPWNNEVYGWAYFKGGRGLVFANNVHFASRKLELNLGPAFGLDVKPGAALDVVSHFPERRSVTRDDGSPLRCGEGSELWLRPFEVLMMEVGPAGSKDTPAPRRGVFTSQAESLGLSLSLKSLPLAAWMNIEFADAQRFEREGMRYRAEAFAAILPPLEGEQPILALAVRLRKGGQEWRYSPVVAEIVQVVARIGSEHLVLIPVPDGRQFGNTQKAGCSWVVYKARLRRQWSGENVKIAIHSYLPVGVEARVEGWIVKQWWHESGRPLPDGFFANEPS